MKVEAFGCLILLQEKRVFECDPKERHLLNVCQLRQTETIDRREWNLWHHDHLGALKEFLVEHPQIRAEPLRPFGWHGQGFCIRVEG